MWIFVRKILCSFTVGPFIFYCLTNTLTPKTPNLSSEILSKPIPNRHSSALLSRLLVCKKRLHSPASPMTVASTIVRGDPGLNGFLTHNMVTTSGGLGIETLF